MGWIKAKKPSHATVPLKERQVCRDIAGLLGSQSIPVALQQIYPIPCTLHPLSTPVT